MWETHAIYYTLAPQNQQETHLGWEKKGVGGKPPVGWEQPLSRPLEVLQEGALRKKHVCSYMLHGGTVGKS